MHALHDHEADRGMVHVETKRIKRQKLMVA